MQAWEDHMLPKVKDQCVRHYKRPFVTKKSNWEVQSWTKCWQREATVQKSLTTHLIRTSAIRNPIPDPPPVIKATWSLQTHTNKSLSLCMYMHIEQCRDFKKKRRKKTSVFIVLTWADQDCRHVCMCSCTHQSQRPLVNYWPAEVSLPWSF